jgi:hypothetical protein
MNGKHNYTTPNESLEEIPQNLIEIESSGNQPDNALSDENSSLSRSMQLQKAQDKLEAIKLTRSDEQITPTTLSMSEKPKELKALIEEAKSRRNSANSTTASTSSSSSSGQHSPNTNWREQHSPKKQHNRNKISCSII